MVRNSQNKNTIRMDGVFVLVWVFGWWIRKAALSDSPVDCRNRRGFAAAKRIHHSQIFWSGFCLVGDGGKFEPIAVQHAGGMLLTQVRKLVATSIFSSRLGKKKCKLNPPLQAMGRGKWDKVKAVTQNGAECSLVTYDGDIHHIYKKEFNGEMIGYVNFFRKDRYRTVAYCFKKQSI